MLTYEEFLLVSECFVLLGFCLVAFYSYQIMEKERDYQTVILGLVITFLLISIPGWRQVFKHGLLNELWMQRLVMSEEQFAVYGGEIADLFKSCVPYLISLQFLFGQQKRACFPTGSKALFRDIWYISFFGFNAFISLSETYILTISLMLYIYEISA